MATGRSCRWPSLTAASRWSSSACTPPLPISPSRCSVPPRRFTAVHSSTSGGSRKNSSDSIACEMRTMSCGTTRPAPRFRWPTSLFPIWPSGNPTARPEASSSVRGARCHSRCHTGVSPSSMALPSRPGRKPQPSSTINTTGVRAPRDVGILKGMQYIHALRALPVALLVVAPLASQARYRVTADNDWFYAAAEGRRLAQIARGAEVQGGAIQGDWIAVTLDGWIFASSVGPSPKPEFDLAVTPDGGENLRAAPGGALVGHLAKGFGLKQVATETRWVRVQRQGWMKRASLLPLASVSTTTTQAGDSDTTSAGLTPGRRPGVTSPAAPPGSDSTAVD